MKVAASSGRWAGVWLLLAALAADASFAPVAELPGSQPVGSGRLTWLGMTVYQATLYAPDGIYLPDRPHALRIDYAFSFSRERLARASLQEIERIYGPQADGSQLVERLMAVFRDVAKGDHITGVHYPGQGAAFYSEGRLLGRLEDATLAQAFFAIWLNPQTSEPDLRAQLMGLAP